MYVPNLGGTSIYKANANSHKERNTIIEGDFTIPHSSMDRSSM